MGEKKGNHKDLLIIIPAHNEENSIANVLDQLRSSEIKQIADVLIMNDASSDRTEQIISQYSISTVNVVFNLGYGSAIQLGYKYALRNGYDYVIQMDADGQHDVCNIPRIYEALKTKDADGHCPDIVLASRFMEDSAPFRVSVAKKIAFRLFRRLIYFATKRIIYDPTTGLQGLNRKTLEYYAGFDHFDDRYPDANMILRMLMKGYHLNEIPAVMHQRESGTSMFSGLKPVVYMIRMTGAIIAVYFSEKHNTHKEQKNSKDLIIS